MNPVQQFEAEAARLERMLDRQAELGLRPSRSYERRLRELRAELAHARAEAGIAIRGDVDPSWFATPAS